MRAKQGDGLGELVAAMAPPEFRICDIALMAVRETEVVLAGWSSRLSLSCGMSSDNQSRWFSVK